MPFYYQYSIVEQAHPGGASMRGTLKTALFQVFSAILLTAGLTAAVWASSDAPAFLHIPGINGNADDPAHRNWIEVLSCDWGKVPPPRGAMVSATGKGPAGKLCFGDFSFLKQVDESSEVLAEYCSRGVQLSQIRVELPASEGGSFKYLILRKVKILSVRPGRTNHDGIKTEVVTVGFRQVEYQ
jgi:type VI secretion system secreted protein Hcp